MAKGAIDTGLTRGMVRVRSFPVPRGRNIPPSLVPSNRPIPRIPCRPFVFFFSIDRYIQEFYPSDRPTAHTNSQTDDKTVGRSVARVSVVALLLLLPLPSLSLFCEVGARGFHPHSLPRPPPLWSLPEPRPLSAICTPCHEATSCIAHRHRIG